MKLVLVLTFLLCSSVAYTQQKAHPPAPRCDESLWKEVFTGDPRQFKKPQERLQIIERCKTVTGYIVAMRPESDGDLHILLSLDPGQAVPLTAKNWSGQRGSLVVEPICMRAPTEGSALKQRACTPFRQKFIALEQVRLNLGQKRPRATHVEVTGAFVRDMEHGWNEIHPVTSITITPRAR